MRLLLVSNSGSPFLAHCAGEIDNFLGAVRHVGYVTAARLGDADVQYEKARTALGAVGVKAEHFPADEKLAQRIAGASAIFCSGGNTYALLSRIHALGAMDVLAARVRAGLPYIGTSAGSNIAGPNILATNDWNVVGATRFDAMNLVPWVINPHYQQADPAMAAGSETRDMRIAEFLRANRHPVLGIEEQAAVRVEAGIATAVGAKRLRLFVPGREPVWIEHGARVPMDSESLHGT
jgi:dipeptidase E